MRIVLVSSEAVPYSKTGGLADVSTALAKALSELGHDVWLVMPHYPQINANRNLPASHDSGMTLEIPVGPKRPIGKVFGSELPNSKVKVVQISQPDYFDRPGIYGDRNGDYQDNCERFVFFGRAVMEVCRQMMIKPEIIHANDWQTGLIPALLQIEYRERPDFQQTASVFTIHNLLFQGQFWHWDMSLTGLDWKYYNWEQMEAYSKLNLLKTGVVFSEKITTVSPTYAKEIQTEQFGCGLQETLKNRSADLVGILNGIDPEEWNPKTDRHLPAHFDAKKVQPGKGECKAALQKEVGLPIKADAPLLGLISRMTEQKGIPLILEQADAMLAEGVQLVFLGTGDPRLEHELSELAHRHPDQVSTTIGFDESLAHRIEAGADMFLMPSEFEPCGLNQMYSMRYGTIPIVRKVGGLADSVTPAKKKNLAAGTAKGFQLEEHTGEALFKKVSKAMSMYHDKPIWNSLIKAGMSHDWSWAKSAQKYVAVYQEAIEKRRKAADET